MKKRIVVYVATLLLSCISLHAQTGGGPGLQLGRKWWVGATRSERSGFLNGFLDCKFPKPSASVKGYGLSLSDLSSRIDAFYLGHKESHLSIGELVEKIDGPVKPTPSLPGAEVYTNPHGYYDGLWWRGALGDEQPGYVEGYLVCLGRPVGRPSAQRLANAISAWYGKHPSKEDRAIAYVLEDILKAKKDSHHCQNSGPQ